MMCKFEENQMKFSVSLLALGLGKPVDLGQGVRSRSCLSAERRHFSSPRKKHLYFTKSFPNGIIGCVERGFYKKNHPIICFR